METIIVCIALIIGVQIIMYWQLATQVEELQRQMQRQEEQIKELRLSTESIKIQQQQLFADSFKTDRQRYEYLKTLPDGGDSKYFIR